MENRQSLLITQSVPISNKIFIRIPKVGEILDDEQSYYTMINSLTATPSQYMVQLDDMGIDYTTLSEYHLFLMLFPNYAKTNMSILFGNMDLSDLIVCTNPQNNEAILYSPSRQEIIIDEFVYMKIVETIRKINLIKKDKTTPGNEEAKKYILDRERKRLRRNINKPYEPYLEKIVVALVNSPEFKYKYDETMELTIYQFMRSFEQIQTRITYDKTMIGVYAGTVDTTKISDKSNLSWIPISKK